MRVNETGDGVCEHVGVDLGLSGNRFENVDGKVGQQSLDDALSWHLICKTINR
jgi:hypothetical protein